VVTKNQRMSMSATTSAECSRPQPTQ
jgi:hypothetical protein